MKRSTDRQGAVFGALVAVLAVSVIVLLASGLGLPLYLDDTHSTFYAFDGVGRVVDHLSTDSHPPLYFWLLALWMPRAGMGELALRVPSMLFYVVTGLTLFSYGAKSLGREAGLFMAFLFLLSPLALFHAHTVRMYALLGLLSALSTTLLLLLTRDERSPGWGTWGAYVVLNALGTLTHYWFFFLLSGQAAGAVLLFRGSVRKKVLLAIGASVVPFALVWGPVLLQQTQGGPTGWMEPPSGLWLIGSPLSLYGLGAQRWVPLLMYLGLLAACGIRLGVSGPRLTGMPEVSAFLSERNVRLLAIMVAAVLVLAYAVSQYRPVYHWRYLITVLPAFAILMALALWRLGDRVLRVAFLVAFVVGSSILHVGTLGNAPQRDDRAAAEHLIREFEEGDEAVFVTLSAAPLTHYLRALAPGRTFSTTVFPREVADHIGWRDLEGMSASREALKIEAEVAAERWKRRAGLTRVWLFAGGDSTITDLMVEALDKDFELEEAVPLSGWWHEEIQIFVPKAGLGVGGDQGSSDDVTGAG